MKVKAGIKCGRSVWNSPGLFGRGGVFKGSM